MKRTVGRNTKPTVISSLSLGAALLAGACGGGDDPIVELDNAGFVAPAGITQAHVGEGEAMAADWSCLNTPTDDVPTNVDITVTGALVDFQNEGTELDDATVEVFPGIEFDNALDSAGPTDATGAFELTLTAGSTRYGYKVTAPDYLDTFLLNQAYDPDTATVTQNISAISEGLAQALPLFVGLERTAGTGVLAGAMRDCQDREVSNAVATVSATSGEIDHLDGAVTYYLSSAAGLPVRHDQLLHTDSNGLFAVFELPPTTQAFIQVWGFVDEADVAMGEAGLTLLAELPSPVLGESVITGSIEPLRTE